MVEIDSQVPEAISQLVGADRSAIVAEAPDDVEDLDESNANFSDEGRADPVIASSPAFSTHEFRQKYTMMINSGNGSVMDTCSNQDSLMLKTHSKHTRQQSNFSLELVDAGIIPTGNSR